MQKHRFLATVVILAIAMPTAICATGEDGPPRAATPPHWSKEVLDAFFDDARQQLVGKRPPTAALEPKGRWGSESLNTKKDSNQQEKATSWSQWIDADTLTTEIKRLNNGLARVVTSLGRFKSDGYQQCRRDFSMLAVLFGVVHEFDEPIRWQRDAARMQAALTKASKNCKVASDASFSEARHIRTLLDELVRGQSPQRGSLPEETTEKEPVDYSELMKHMELTLKQRVSPSLADANSFRKRTGWVAHESQLLAVLAEVLQQDGYEYADDDTYLEYARELRNVSAELTKASMEGNFGKARAAAGRVTQACDRCHEGYRD